jgi:hypothetical protein
MSRSCDNYNAGIRVITIGIRGYSQRRVRNSSSRARFQVQHGLLSGCSGDRLERAEETCAQVCQLPLKIMLYMSSSPIESTSIERIHKMRRVYFDDSRNNIGFRTSGAFFTRAPFDESTVHDDNMIEASSEGSGHPSSTIA